MSNGCFFSIESNTDEMNKINQSLNAKALYNDLDYEQFQENGEQDATKSLEKSTMRLLEDTEKIKYSRNTNSSNCSSYANAMKALQEENKALRAQLE